MKKKPPAQVKINLLPKDPFFDSVVGRTLKWALSAGRYIVIFTELVVILSFVARFTLDRQVTDLNSEILQKESIIESYGSLEEDFRAAQSKIATIEDIKQDANIADVFPYISEVTPEGIVFSELVIRPGGISASGSTISQTALNLLITNLQVSPHFLNVSIDRIESQERNDAGFEFRLRADTKIVQKVTPSASGAPVNVLDRTQGL